MFETLIALALSSGQVATSPSQPRTSATACDALYYGLARKPDLAAAYRCYGADGDFQMQIIMAINGDGVRRSVRLIDDLFDRWERKDPGAALSGENDPLRVALGSLRAGSPVKHLAFCEGIAASTLDSMRCDSIRQHLRKAETTRLLRRIGGALSHPQQIALENLHVAFDRFKEAEGDRGYQVLIQGSIRHTAGALQEDYVLEHFMSHVETIVGKLTLAPSSEGSLRSAIAALNSVYQEDMVEHQTEEKDAVGVGEGYAAVTAKAKEAWDAYRRAWIVLVNSLPFSNMGPSDSAQAIETLLTLERVDELKHNILGIR